MRTLLILLLLSSGLHAAENLKHYVIVSGYQNSRNAIFQSHTFATFIEVAEQGGVETLRQDTISWLPKDYSRSRRLRHTRGHSFSFRESVGFSRGKILWHSPAYPISSRAYGTALAHLKYLRSGRVNYRVFDRFSRRRGRAVNCIHAVSDVAGFLRTRTLRGISASKAIVSHFRRTGFIQSGPSDSNLIRRLK